MLLSVQGPAIFDDASRSPTKTSMLRSILPSKGHKKNNSTVEPLPGAMTEANFLAGAGFLPADHPHAQPLTERAHNKDAAGAQSKKGGLHKKTKSSVSLRSLLRDREKKDKQRTPSDLPDEEGSLGKTMKKVKSATSLSALLKRSNRSRKDEPVAEPKDKENRRPASEVVSPIWAQFATQPLETPTGSVYVPESQRTLEDEVSLYTPKIYSPSKQRNFYDYQPTLVQKPRPKSDYVSTSGTMKVREMLGQISRVPSGKRRQPEPQAEQGYFDNRSNDNNESKRTSTNSAGRVMAVVTALNAKDADARKVDDKQIESEFEKLLDARNIPMNMRDKMRSLDTNIKADFIQKNQAENSCPNSATSSTFESAGRRGRKNERSSPSDTRDKSMRSLSRARSPFTSTSRGDNSQKKHQKSNSASSFKRPKSVDLSRPYMLQTASVSSTSLHGKVQTDTAADPADFIHYLREVQKPELVEVGKLHKLRLLLRNETVAWVDSFIAGDGMDEIVQLLYRIMKVEWREEHEDNLLHEALLCLKALCTTSVALQRLTALSRELFPALLRMIFDEERKGPSEFATRGVIISLLFTHLESASNGERPARAAEILAYLRDPAPNNQHVEFITNIYQSRPYRVWCKEVTNVTKEVFWIFLHHLNVIPLNRETAETIPEGDNDYFKKHFPAPRPPVPAAPYVGGVEWDATNYIATHLDLMNGLIACQPTKEQRNALREDFRVSGFEKVMGGSIRTCKEKFYGAVHDCLKTWIAAAHDDGWDYRFVREGPEPGSPKRSSIKASSKKPVEEPPKLALDINLDKKPSNRLSDIEGWI